MMTVKELRQLIKGLDPETKIVLDLGDKFMSVCGSSDIEILIDEITGEQETVVLLAPCFCREEDEDESQATSLTIPVEIETPNLN